MNPLLLEILNKTIEDYNNLHLNEALPFPVPENMKNLCISAIDARIEALEAEKKTDEKEYSECRFLINSLKNGWLVSDIPMLMSLYEGMDSLSDGSIMKSEGKQILDQIASVNADRIAERFEALLIVTRFLGKVKERTEEIEDAVGKVNAQYKNKIIYATEYPRDNEFDKFRDVDKEKSRVKFVDLVTKNDNYLKMLAARDQRAREKEDYTFKELSEAEKSILETSPFVPNDGQKHNNIKKTNRQVIKEVYGDDIYDDIDEMRIGSIDDRRVVLHHSQGTKWQKKGEDVLSIEIAGSGAEDVIKSYKGRTGHLKDSRYVIPADVEKLRGKQVKRKDGSTFDYIRSFDRTITNDENKKVKRIKYSIGGASPNWLWGMISGLFNLGEYSIESSRDHAKSFAKEFLVPIFEDWKNGNGEPHDIHISLAGHSRGGVTAGQGVKAIHKWLNEYEETHPEVKEFRKHIRYDLRMTDPVPGMITNLHLSSCDLRDIPNVNATVVCSLAQDHFDLLFPLQHVKGAKKIILTTTDHMMDVRDTDDSQLDVMGDGKKHITGYYDAETGEMYRSSGLSELPDGVYVADENKNIIRVSSYSQVSKIFSNLYEDTSPQRSRYVNIHHMVRDWFVENSLQMSFPDEKTREFENENNNDTVDRILQSPNKRLDPVKTELNRLKEMKNATDEEILARRKILTNVCREYMKNTRIPATGDSEYRVGLVSDVLSFNMKETNYLEKKISLAKNEIKEFPLDEKIKAHKDRLDNKEGYHGRKNFEENRRLNREKEILNAAKDTAKKCNDYLTILDTTRVGKLTSEEYDNLHDVLKKGEKLGEKSTIRELIEFHKKLTEVADKYTLYHDSLLGPLTTDGQNRLEISKKCSEIGKKTGKLIEDKSKTLGDRDIPIGRRIEKREASVQAEKDKMKAKNIAAKI